MSAWIEIFAKIICLVSKYVALYMSAWIEIVEDLANALGVTVALYMSAWIEIRKANHCDSDTISRTLHECVD